MIWGAHAVLAAAAWVFLWRAVGGGALADAGGAETASAFALALALAGLGGSAIFVAAGRIGPWSPGRAAALDAASFAAVLWAVALVSLGEWSRDLGGVAVALVVAVRVAPVAVALARGAPAWMAFAGALAAYAALAAWLSVAAQPFGDQVHYLLAADRLAQGSLDATIDRELFRSLLAVPPSDGDVATHVVEAPAGPRTVQGYAVAAVLLPGWVLWGRLGAHLAVAVVAAFAALQLYLLLRETIVGRRLAAAAWALAAFLPPFLPMAAHIYPNVFGAALIAAAYRYLFTAATPRPALGGALLAATLLLTPRDGLALLLLAPFVWRLGAPLWRPFAVGAGAVALAVVAANALFYGIPIPYAGYLYGTAQAQELTAEPSLTFRFWVGLPAILFDRTFGLAGSAPYLFVGLLGIAVALRDRRLVPAAAAIGGSLAALSIFRYWEGGYAPPGRYFVDVLPLWAPFVAHGLARAATWPLRIAAGAAVFMSALAAVVLSAMPTAALNGAFDHKLQEIYDSVLGLNPLGWLPSFQPTTPDWYVAAYLRLLPALAICAILVWYALRRERATESAP